MDPLPLEEYALGINDFLLSLRDKAWIGGVCSVRGSSPDRRKRANMLDCFFLGAVLNSIVGAVVMISGGAVEPALAEKARD